MIFIIFTIILGIIFQAPAMERSGIVHGYGIPYFGPLARDGVWHEALANSLKNSVPPINPGFSGQILSNYHYFYDLIVAVFSKITSIPVSYFIYQFFPIIFSILLGIGTYLLAKRLFEDKIVSILAVFLAYFGSSFGWVVSIIKHEEIGGESTFWANQPVSMNLNPPYAISLIILIFGMLLLDKFLRKPKFWDGCLLVIIFGTLIGFKAYAGAIVIVSLLALTLKRILIDKNNMLLPIFLASSFLFFVIYLFVSRGGAGLITIQPFWLINTMIDAGDRVGIMSLSARRFAYLSGHKYLYLLGVEAISFAIFFLGNLGTRIAAFWGFKKKYLKDNLHLFTFFLMAASFFPVLIFVQKGNPWNIVQFFYYFMFFTGLYAANALRKFALPVIIVFIIITPISSAATFRSWLYPNPPAFVPLGEYQALSFLKTQPQGAVLKVPYDPSVGRKFKDPYPIFAYADNAYVSAYSAHAVYIEDAQQQLILDTGFQSRLDDVNRFFIEKDLTWSSRFLKENKIKYIYLPEVYHLPMAEQEYPMKKIFENSSAKIYIVDQ